MEQWFHEDDLEERRPPFVLANLGIEEDLSQHNPNHDNDPSSASVFDQIITQALQFMRLTKFYAVLENEIRAYYVPVSNARHHSLVRFRELQ